MCPSLQTLGDAEKAQLRKRMEDSVKQNYKFERIVVSRDEALGMFQENKFKVRGTQAGGGAPPPGGGGGAAPPPPRHPSSGAAPTQGGGAASTRGRSRPLSLAAING